MTMLLLFHVIRNTFTVNEGKGDDVERQAALPLHTNTHFKT